MSINRGAAVAVVGVAMLFGAGATRSAPPAGQPASRELARKVQMLAIEAVDERYIYFLTMNMDDPGADQHLRRAPKAGGPAEAVPGAEDAYVLDYVRGPKANGFLIVSEYGLAPTADIAVLDDSTNTLKRILPGRPNPWALIVKPAGLFWMEGDEASDWPNKPRKLALMTSDLAGRNARTLWQGSVSGILGLAATDSHLFLFLAAPKQAIPPKKPGGTWRSVKPGTFSSILRIPQAGGAAEVIWKEADLLTAGVVDGGDVYACGMNGLFKVPATGRGSGKRIQNSCRPELQVWHGWRFNWEKTLQFQPLLFGRVDGGNLRELFAQTLGLGVGTDDNAIYTCVVGNPDDPTRCDLTRIDAAGLEARAKAPSP